jgi:hypothetical protein
MKYAAFPAFFANPTGLKTLDEECLLHRAIHFFIVEKV